jgi:ribonuclease HI
MRDSDCPPPESGAGPGVRGHIDFFNPGYNGVMPYSTKPTKKKFYVVWKGRQTGIFTTWEACAAQVNGFVGAEYKAFDSRAEAEAALKGSYSDFKGKTTPAKPRQPNLLASQPIRDSYCVDAASRGNPGVMEYRGVYTATRKEIFHQGPFPDGTNNVGEFLAIVDALVMLKEQGIKKPIYSDSANALLWLKLKKCRTRLKPSRQNAPLFERIRQAEEWLKTNPYVNKVLKWDTQAWGEIPADFGRK